jgi:hypothetical protein
VNLGKRPRGSKGVNERGNDDGRSGRCGGKRGDGTVRANDSWRDLDAVRCVTTQPEGMAVRLGTTGEVWVVQEA